MLRETAYAKLNLALHIRAREPDGYHRIETLFAFCADGDELAVAPGTGLALRVSGPFAASLGGDAPGDNLVLRAAAALRDHYDVRAGADFDLDKRLPVAAGLGGGSADAAAALRLLVRFWSLPHEPAVLHAIARDLGADVPACLDSRTVRGEGRGDALRPAFEGADLAFHVLLVNPRVSVPTAPVFAGWDGVDRGPLDAGQLVGRNDLLAPALTIAPEIGDVLAALGEGLIGMSGSGATCFRLFDSSAECAAVAEAIGANHPGWWTFETCLR